MTTYEIISGIIEAFTRAISEKSNWGSKQAHNLLLEVVQSFPISNPIATAARFAHSIEDKTSWGKNQLVLKLHGIIIESLATELDLARNDEPAPAVEAVPNVPKPAGPVPKYRTAGAMIVAAAKDDWLRTGAAKACTNCKTNRSVITFKKGDATVAKCYVCGARK